MPKSGYFRTWPQRFLLQVKQLHSKGLVGPLDASTEQAFFYRWCGGASNTHYISAVKCGYLHALTRILCPIGHPSERCDSTLHNVSTIV